MSIRSWGGRMVAGAAAAGVLLGVAAGTAAAWPIPLTGEQQRFVDTARGSFPADTDTLMLMGSQMCRGAYTGKPDAAIISEAAGTYGASPEQAAGVFGAARGTLCTQAPRN